MSCERKAGPPFGLRSIQSNDGPPLLKELTSRQYADVVFAHAQRGIEASIFPGSNFDNLASYLRNPFTASHIGSTGSIPVISNPQTFSFVRSYSITANGIDKGKDLSGSEDLPEPLPPADDANAWNGTLLFLRGQPSSLWLDHIGAKYRTNAEFYQRHLSSYLDVGRLDYHCHPSLPSSSKSFLQLPLFTIGHQDGRKDIRDQKLINNIREASSRSMARYLNQVGASLYKDDGVGLSLVRNFWMLDEKYFVLQQDASIHFVAGPNGWICYIWTDSSRSLLESPPGPWWLDSNMQQASRTRFYPTIQSVPTSMLRSHHFSMNNENSHLKESTQSSSLLSLAYGKTLESSVLAHDPFHLVHELCKFSACSQTQFLNLVRSKILVEIHQTPDSDYYAGSLNRAASWDPSNLLYYKQILELHVDRLRENIESMKARCGLGPVRTADSATEEKSRVLHESLLNDYRSLLSKTEHLAARCREGVDLLNNRAMIAESNKSIDQAREVAKLTRLAFVYIPISFTAAVFGMNVDPIIKGSANSIWVWVVLSIPILCISLLVMRWDLSEALDTLFSRKRRRQTQEEVE